MSISVAHGVDVLLEQHGERKTDYRAEDKLGADTHDNVVRWIKPSIRPASMLA